MNFFIEWNLWVLIYLAVIGVVFSNNKSRVIESHESSLVEKYPEFKVSVLFAILSFLPIIIIAANRDEMFADTSAYIAMYKSWPSSVDLYIKDVDWDSRFPGFMLFSVFCKQLGLDYRFWLGLIATISGVFLALGYRKYTSDIVTCAFLFFASTDYMSWMMNGIRQFLVAAILFFSFSLIQKKKYILFIALVLVLFTIHRSAILVIPLYFAALGKPFNKKTLIVLLLCLLAVVFSTQFLDIMDDALQTTSYNNLVSEFNDDGTNFFRVLVYSIPAILAVIFKKRFDETTPEIINISVNMSLISMGLYVISMFTSGIFLGRLPIYFSLFGYILLIWEINNLFEESMRKIIRIIMIVLYMVFYCYTWLM